MTRQAQQGDILPVSTPAGTNTSESGVHSEVMSQRAESGTFSALEIHDSAAAQKYLPGCQINFDGGKDKAATTDGATDSTWKSGEPRLEESEARLIADLLKDGKVDSYEEYKALQNLLSKTKVEDLEMINSYMEKSGSPFRLQESLGFKVGGRFVFQPGYNLVNKEAGTSERVHSEPKYKVLGK